MATYVPSSQSLLYNHMTTFIDYRCKGESKICINEGSVYDILSKNSNFSKFKNIVDKAKLSDLLNDLQFNNTIFIVPNRYINIDELSIDDGLARQIVNASIIPKILASDLLKSSPVSYFYTKNPKMRMYVTNISNMTTINNCSNVINYDIWCNNGIIHIINNLILPNEDHYMN